MGRKNLVYFDMMLLSALCGAPIHDPVEEEALETVFRRVRSGTLQHIDGFAHAAELRKYKNRVRRACMRRLLQFNAIVQRQDRQARVHHAVARRAGASTGDAMHIAAAFAAEATLLTWDRQVLHLRKKLKGGTICTPAEYVKGSDEEDKGKVKEAQD